MWCIQRSFSPYLHLLPSLEQGLSPLFFGIIATLLSPGRHGDIPKLGRVHPQIETMGFENAEAMCINPVSPHTTNLDC